MKNALPAAIALTLIAGFAQAQVSTASPAGTPPSASGTATTRGALGSSAVNPNAITNSTAPAAVSTTTAPARTTAAPVPGANSYTEGEARRRIEEKGFGQVSGLKKDDHGIWRGTAMKDGKSTAVALDYQGNIVAQ